jgi:hypothetical protein
MPQHVDVSQWKNVWNVQQTEYAGAFPLVKKENLRRQSHERLLAHTESKASATSKKTAPVSRDSQKFL